MRWLIILQTGLSAAAAARNAPRAPSDQVPLVNTTYNNYALNPMFRYVPEMAWPRDPSEGWNFSTTIGASSPYDPPEQRLAYPFTTLPGASVGQRFFGSGITVYGWGALDTRFVLSIGDFATDVTLARRMEGELLTLVAPENRWIDFNLTLTEGALQLFNVSIHQQLYLEWASQDAAPQPLMKAIEDDGATMNAFFKTEGDVVAKIGDIDGEGPLMAMSPGARVSFRTWPNATMVRLLGQVGREGGVIAYEMIPEPASVRTVTWDLLRTHDYFMDVGYHLLDPTQRFTFRVWNEHPRSRIYFRGVTFLVGTEEAMKWDPLTDTMKEEGKGASSSNTSSSGSSSTGTSKNSGQNHDNGGSSGSGGNGSGRGGGDESRDDAGAGATEEQSGKHANVGAIAGGIIGGLVGIILFGLALLACLFPARIKNLLSKRHTPQAPADRYDLDDPDLVDITEASSHPIVTPLPAPEPKPDPGQGYNKSMWDVLHAEKEAQQLLPGEQRQSTVAPEELPEIEDDAGPVPFQPRRADTLPPTYNPAWADTSSVSAVPSGSGSANAGPLASHEYKALASGDAGSSMPRPVKRKT